MVIVFVCVSAVNDAGGRLLKDPFLCISHIGPLVYALECVSIGDFFFLFFFRSPLIKVWYLKVVEAPRFGRVNGW